jgi:hypothetical protein
MPAEAENARVVIHHLRAPMVISATDKKRTKMATTNSSTAYVRKPMLVSLLGTRRSDALSSVRDFLRKT